MEDDPRSSDFGKIKSDNIRWDIWGGFQPYARVLTQLVTGQRKTQKAGVYDIDKKYGQNRMDVLTSFGRGKLAPVPGLFSDIIAGRTAGGQKVKREFGVPNFNNNVNEINLTNEAIQHFTPLLWQDVLDAWQTQGAKALLTAGIPSTFGVGVQTYGNTSNSAIEGRTSGRANTRHTTRTVRR